MLRLFLSIVIMVTFLSSSNLNFSVTIATALKAFKAGDFSASAQSFEQLVDAGLVNGDLYYNLGSAYYRLGNLGKATAAMLAARRYLPRNPDVVANFQVIHEKARDQLDPRLPRNPSAVLGEMLGYFTLREWFFTSIIFVAFAMLVNMVAAWRRHKILRITAATLFCFGLLCGLAHYLLAELVLPWGAVIVESAKIYSGPGEHNPVLFELHAGAPFAEMKEDQGFYLLQLSDGKIGWISATDAKVYP